MKKEYTFTVGTEYPWLKRLWLDLSLTYFFWKMLRQKRDLQLNIDPLPGFGDAK